MLLRYLSDRPCHPIKGSNLEITRPLFLPSEATVLPLSCFPSLLPIILSFPIALQTSFLSAGLDAIWFELSFVQVNFKLFKYYFFFLFSKSNFKNILLISFGVVLRNIHNNSKMLLKHSSVFKILIYVRLYFLYIL